MPGKLRVYSDDECQQQLQQRNLTKWTLQDGWLRRKYSTSGWPVTLMLTNAIGYLCQAADHHADLAVSYAKLWVKLKTHSESGITDKDFELAQKIEQEVLWRPEEASALDGVDPKKFVHDKE